MFEILYGDKQVGRVQVIKEGMYYRFACSCTLPDNGIHRIKVSDGTAERDLGICVPEGNQFTVIARVPVKFLKGDKFSFRLEPQKAAAVTIPVETGEPFAYLEELDVARLQSTQDYTEILIETTPNQQDSDPNQAHESKSEWR